MNREITPNEIANAIREVLDEKDDLKTQIEEQNKALNSWYEKYHKLKREKEIKDKEIERLNNEIKTLLKENGNKEKVIIKQNNIIEELEKDLQSKIDEDRLNIISNSHWLYVLDKLKALKEGK